MMQPDDAKYDLMDDFDRVLASARRDTNSENEEIAPLEEVDAEETPPESK